MDSIIKSGVFEFINSRSEAQVSNQHQNFWGTFHSRTLMVKRVSEEGVSVREVVANQFGVSRRTVHN